MTVPHYFDYLVNRVEIQFKPKDSTSGEPEFSLMLSRKMTYDMVKRVTKGMIFRSVKRLENSCNMIQWKSDFQLLSLTTKKHSKLYHVVQAWRSMIW